jgi:hypothetical protein
MMHWNHRVMNCPSENGGTDDYFTFKEVYYNAKTNEPYAYGNPFIGGDTFEELEELVEHLKTALGNPVLHENNFALGGKYYAG